MVSGNEEGVKRGSEIRKEKERERERAKKKKAKEKAKLFFLI
jgi:hypothetical protein